MILCQRREAIFEMFFYGLFIALLPICGPSGCAESVPALPGANVIKIEGFEALTSRRTHQNDWLGNGMAQKLRSRFPTGRPGFKASGAKLNRTKNRSSLVEMVPKRKIIYQLIPFLSKCRSLGLV